MEDIKRAAKSRALFVETLDADAIKADPSRIGLKGSPTHAVTYENVRVPANYLMREGGKGLQQTLTVLDGGRALEDLDADEPGNRCEVLVTGPSSETHLDHRHAQCLEVLARQRIALSCRQLGKAQFDVATDDGPTGAGDRMGDDAERAPSAERDTMWQQAKQAQQGHAEPYGPGMGCPVTGKGFAIAHALP
mgnify:CR=1 FL=1